MHFAEVYLILPYAIVQNLIKRTFLGNILDEAIILASFIGTDMVYHFCIILRPPNGKKRVNK